MNLDIYNARIRQLKGKTRIWRGKLTGNRRERIAGRYDLMAGKWHEKHSLTLHKASNTIDRHIAGYRKRLKHLRWDTRSK